MDFEKTCSCMGKSLDHFLQPTILMILNKEEMHGFLLLQKISETPLFASNYPDPSGLYRYLKKMEQQGLLTSREEHQQDFPSKRIYTITETGRHCMENWADTLSAYVTQLNELTVMLKSAIAE